MLGENLHDASVRSQALVGRKRRRRPGPTGHLEDASEPVGLRLVGTEHAEVARVADDDVAEVATEDAHRLGVGRSGICDVHAVLPEVREDQVAHELAAVRMRVRTHSRVALGSQSRDIGRESTVVVEELLRAIALHPGLELLEMLGVLAHAGEGNLVGAPCPLDGHAVDLARSRPALGRTKNEHRPPARGRLVAARRGLNGVDRVERGVERDSEALVNRA